MARSERNARPDTIGAFKPLGAMLRDEIAQADGELQRRLVSLILSAGSAGFTIGTSVLLIVTFHSSLGDEIQHPLVAIVTASLYAVGFVLVILGRMDLFTEFTTIAVLPVLRGRAAVSSLVRFWLVIYAGNLAGAWLFSLLLAGLSAPLGIDAQAIRVIATGLVDHDWWVMILSGVLAGYLMGLLSWLLVGGRETISRILFIALVAFTIGYGHLHHSIVGAIEVFVAAIQHGEPSPGDIVRFLGLVTIGNAIGGVGFAASIHFSIATDATVEPPA